MSQKMKSGYFFPKLGWMMHHVLVESFMMSSDVLYTYTYMMDQRISDWQICRPLLGGVAAQCVKEGHFVSWRWTIVFGAYNKGVMDGPSIHVYSLLSLSPIDRHPLMYDTHESIIFNFENQIFAYNKTGCIVTMDMWKNNIFYIYLLLVKILSCTGP